MANSVDPRCLLLYLIFVINVRQLFADFSRRHFHMHFFLGALRVKSTPKSNEQKRSRCVLTYLQSNMCLETKKRTVRNDRKENIMKEKMRTFYSDMPNLH